MPTPNQAVQQEELEILRSIFTEEWHDIPPKKTAWGTEVEAGWWEVSIQGEDERVALGFRFRFPKLYPNQPPLLTLVEPRNLSPTHVRTLLRLLQDKAKSSLGGPMIFDLVDMAKDWITRNHLPLSKKGEKVPTLMEEMAKREEEKRAAAEAQYQDDKAKEAAIFAEKTRILHEKIQLDANRKEELLRQVESDQAHQRHLETVSTLQDGELENRTLTLSEPIMIPGYEGIWNTLMLFNGKQEKLWVTYIGEFVNVENTQNTDFVRISKPCVYVEIIDFSSTFYSTTQGRRKVEGVVSEIERLKEVRLEGCRKVWGVKREKSPKGWERVIVLLEYEKDEGRLRTLLGQDGLGENIAMNYMRQILRTLADLHEKGMCQRFLDVDSIILSPTSEGNEAKLGGTLYARRLIDLHRSNPFLKNYSDPLPDAWKSPDEAENGYAYTNKRDMWYASVLMVQMIFGPQVIWRYPTPSALLQQGIISETITAVLSGLLQPLPKKRLSANEALQMLKHDLDLSRTLTKVPLGSSTSSSFAHSPMAGNMVSFIQSKPQVGAQNWGRYRKEFEEVEFLGKGGFGEVVKARHLQDGRAYAIKKVRLRPEDNELRVLREVNTLSGLNHINIVRYFSCWLEDVAPPVHTPPDSTSNTPGVLSPTNKDDSDPFAPPRMDDPSLWRRDASKSTSFPRIRFAETEEDEDIDEDEEEDSEGSSDTSDAETISRKTAKGLKVSEEMTSTTIDEMVIKRILYIQMEFVENQTLKEAIAAGLNDSDSWRIFNQILQALAYLSHEKSVVHRDLKPANILLDAHGNAKVSDFGLATTGLVGVETTPGETTEEISDKTSGIGTSLYIAPEVAGSRSYDTKVDMYSLGIIFFEMCYPFKTGMERIQILSALRQPSITFPDGWKPDWKSEQKEIITWLLRHDPSMRPSARQLLLSPLVPSQDKDEMFYDRAINELTNPTSQHHQTLLDALFDPDAHAYTTSYDDRPDDYTFDREQDDSLQVWLSVVIQRLEDLFKRHGAVETDLPLLMPETSLLKAFPNLKPVRLLDVKGKVVLLPFSDLLAMARSATRRQIERIKRYHIGKKYQNYPTLEGQPIVSGDVSFDIISPLRSPAADAEMLEVVDKLISEFRGVKGTSLMEYEFHISHEIVLSTILGLIPLKQRAGVQRVFKEVSPFVTPGQLRSALSGLGLTKNILDELDQCCVIAEFEAVRSKLESHFSTSSTALKLSKALEETSQVITLARSFGIARKIVFRPTLSKHAEFFRGGFMFECVRRGRQGDVVAFGGRYDCLLEHFSQSHTRQVFGVGMSIDVDQLAIMVRRYESTLSTKLMTKDNEDERSFGFWSPSRCDVYVAATAQVDLTQRLSVVGELWRAGIRADLQYDDERSVEEVLTECVDQNTLFLVLPRANRPMVKVRNVLKRSEEEIPRNELCTHLRMAIAEQRRIDATYASAEGSIPSAQAAALSVLVDTKEVVIKLVLPPEPQSSKGKSKPVRKHRHVTKGVYYDKASEFSITTQSNLPILAVDLTPSFLSQLIVDPSWITEDEIWRSFLINMNNTDKEYAGSVRKAVNEMILNNGGKSLLWLFSVREGRGFLLQPK